MPLVSSAPAWPRAEERPIAASPSSPDNREVAVPARRPEDERTDADLVAACRAGDGAAWEFLVRRYQRLIYTVPLRCGLSEEEAADIFQQTCLRLYERLDTVREPSRLGAWLVSTARRLSLDALGKRRASGLIVVEGEASELADSSAPFDERLAQLEEQQRIHLAVARLDDRCRALVYHLFYDPAAPSYQQIAAALGVPIGSVGPVRARCFAKLKALLDER